MLKKHAQIFENILFLTDLLIILSSWMISYYIRFDSGLFEVTKGVPPLRLYLGMLLPITVICALVLRGFGLYTPKRLGTRMAEVISISKACVTTAIFLIAITYFLRLYDFSRLVLILFTVMNIAALSLERTIIRAVFKVIRKKGYNLRHALVVGCGAPARDLIKRFRNHPEIGINVKGVLRTENDEATKEIEERPVIGSYRDIREIIRERGIDKVFIALSWDEHERVVDTLKFIGDETVDIMVIPDIYEFVTLRGGIEEFDGLPIINLRNTPLFGWNIILKRAFDLALSSTLILLTSPLMLVIAVLVKMSSKGPVFYVQERMGLDGATFSMLKFRSMRTGAEASTGPVWASKDDERRTPIGRFLRRTSLDELPQLFNVLKGDMSLVGPRPERPVFIHEFRKQIPRYMLRHKVKAGMTGWAQVNGWRGDTDLRKRIDYDIYYIEHWSLLFDIKIVWLTLWKGFVHRNAY
jgi:Undecaprenyl-phosphate glucose phosphotransferase